MTDMPWRFLRLASRSLIRRNVRLTVEGLAHVPREGPVIIAARHYHHLYDGVALLAMSARPLHVLVASDWADEGPIRSVLDYLCRSARWPTVVRTGAPSRQKTSTAARESRSTGGLLAAVRESVQLLREGRMLLVFPEGYPTIDPEGSVKPGDAFLTFESGFARIGQIAARTLATTVSIVPAGFWYADQSGSRITIRFGSPRLVSSRSDVDTIRREVEQAVRQLSEPARSSSVMP